MNEETHLPETGNGQDLHQRPSMRPKADGADSGVPNEFRNFVADIEYLLEETTSITGADLVRIKAQIKDRIAAAKHSVEEVGTEISQKARTSAASTNTYVHEQPWKSMGIAAAIGFAFGVVIARRA